MSEQLDFPAFVELVKQMPRELAKTFLRPEAQWAPMAWLVVDGRMQICALLGEPEQNVAGVVDLVRAKHPEKLALLREGRAFSYPGPRCGCTHSPVANVLTLAIFDPEHAEAYIADITRSAGPPLLGEWEGPGGVAGTVDVVREAMR
jgi:hypothetical protein